MPLTKLFGLPPAQTDRGVWECSTSYLTYLMKEHRLGPQIMFDFLKKEAPRRFSQSLAPGSGINPSSFDSVGVRSQALSGTLGVLTGQQNLERLTLSPMASASAGNGNGLLCPYRRWCPIHYYQWEISGVRPYIPLTWRIAAVGYCEEHKCHLLDRCPHCHSRLKVIPNRLRVDRCDGCGGSLAKPHPKNLNAAQDATLEFEYWICDQVTHVLGAENYGIEQIPGEPVAHFFSQLSFLHGLSLPMLERRVGISRSTLMQWASGRTKPRWTLLLRVLAELSVPFQLMLWSPKLAASQAIIPTAARVAIESERKKLKRRVHNKQRVRSSVKKLIESRAGIVHCNRAAEILKIPRGTLFYLAGDLLRGQRKKRA